MSEYTAPVAIMRQLRAKTRLTQSQFARRLGISQSAVSMYESGKRSPNFDDVQAIAESLGARISLVPVRLNPPWSRNEQFSRLLYLDVAHEFLADPDRVRAVAARNIEDTSNDPRSSEHSRRWAELLEEGNEIDLLLVLALPDDDNSALLASSPFAGVINDERRAHLLARARDTAGAL